MNLRGWGLQEVSDCISDWRKSRGVLFRTSRDVCVRHHAGGSLSAESSLQAWTQACPGKGSWHSGTHPPGSTAKTPKHIFCNQSYFQLPLPVIWFMDLEKWPAPQHTSAQKPLPFHLLWTHACLAVSGAGAGHSRGRSKLPPQPHRRAALSSHCCMLRLGSSLTTTRIPSTPIRWSSLRRSLVSKWSKGSLFILTPTRVALAL